MGEEEKLLLLKLVAPRGRGRRYYMLYSSRRDLSYNYDRTSLFEIVWSINSLRSSQQRGGARSRLECASNWGGLILPRGL